MNVVVIEEDRESGETLAEVLRDEGHEVAFGTSWAEISSDVKADLVLMNMELLHVGSPADPTLKKLRESLPERPAQVIVLTATSFEQRTSLEPELAPFVVLEKPFSIPDLLEAMKTATARRRETFKDPRPPRALLPKSATRSIANFFGIPVEQAQKLAHDASISAAWVDGPGQGTALMPVAAGPEADADKAFLVWIAEGATYPRHTHDGDECKLLLRGGLRDDDESECWAGELVIHAQGTTHASTAIGGGGCLLAAIVKPARTL